MSGLTPFSGLTRIQPFAGLIIDPATWGTAHEYHRLHRRLHALTLHGSGLAQGLEVVPTDPPSGTVQIEPGVAVNMDGEIIVVEAPVRVALDGRSGTAYITIAHEEQAPPARDGQPQDEQEARGRMVEGFSIEVLDAPPDALRLELARIVLVSGKKAKKIAAARNPWAPKPGEIDTRHRLRLPASLGGLRAALVSSNPAGIDTDHVAGFANLIDACAAAGLHVRPTFVSADSPIPDVDLLYVTGAAGAVPEAERIAEIRQRVERGCWLFADGCGADDAFDSAFRGLVDTLKPAASAPALDAVAVERAILNGRYIFGTPPDGATPGDVTWGPNALVSSRDYGCAWRGRGAAGPLSRACIRDALEFGVNVAACASQLAHAS